MILLEASGASALVLPEAGGRLGSLSIDGVEVLIPGTLDDHPMLWGAFPMVPWAGRVRHGRFTFASREYELPVNLPPHAIHGIGYDRPWTANGDGSIAIELGPPWPFGGHAVQRFTLTDGSLTIAGEVHADRMAMPAQIGWHPWFRRPATLHLDAGAMYERDEEGVPSGALVPPPAGPWDDCFTKLAAPPVVEIEGGPTLTLTSSCVDWVVYTQPTHALCVEPQTGPPDGFTLAPQVVEPGAPLVATFTISWS